MKSTFGDNRIANILQAFCQTPSVSVSFLASRLEVSERTIRNDIKQLNQELTGCAAIEGAQGKYALHVFDSEQFRAACARLRAGGAAEQAVWNAYLDHLAILLTNLRMLTNMDLVVGGRVGACIAPYLSELCRKAAPYDRFARDVDYIFPCMQREHACAMGAAALALEQYGSLVLRQAERTTP